MKSSISKRHARVNKFLDEHPVLANRFEELMDIVVDAGDEIQTADEAEQQIILLIQQMRGDVLGSWGQNQERRLSAALKEDPELRSAGKKTVVAQHIRGD